MEEGITRQEKSSIDAKIERINGMLEVIPVLALVIIGVVILVQIISRYVYPLPWTEEVARICNIWVVFIGAYLVATQDGHVRIGYFADFLPDSWQPWLDLFISLVCMACLGVIVYSGMRAVIALYAVKTAAARVPIPVLFTSTVVGSVLMLIYMGLRVLRNIYHVTSRGKGAGERL
jgi:TRAP-type C4-dicarboxylate transport system permease small subunit